MRQVPALDATPCGIVGDGRVARHFHHDFTLLGLSVFLWSRRVPAPPPPEALASCRTVLLLIRDDAIVSTLLWVNVFDEVRVRSLIPASAAHPFLARVAAKLTSDGIGGPDRTGLPWRYRGDSREPAGALEGDPFHAVCSAAREGL